MQAGEEQIWKQVLRSGPLLHILLQLTELDTILSLRATSLPLIFVRRSAMPCAYRVFHNSLHCTTKYIGALFSCQMTLFERLALYTRVIFENCVHLPDLINCNFSFATAMVYVPAWLGASVAGTSIEAGTRRGGVAEWRSGGVAEWRSGGVTEWRSDGVAEWQSGRVAEWQSGRVAECQSVRVSECQSGRGSLARRVLQGQGDSRF